MKKILNIILSAIVAAPPAFACGGPSFSDMAEELGSLTWLVSDMIWMSVDEISQEHTFFGPFIAMGQHETLWNGDYRWHASESYSKQQKSIDMDFEVNPDDLSASHNAAVAVVEAFFAHPYIVRGAKDLPLAAAIEFLELEADFKRAGPAKTRMFYNGDHTNSPAIAALPEALRKARDYWNWRNGNTLEFDPTSPRVASKELIDLHSQFDRAVADGWGEEIRKNTPQETWSSLRAAHEAWLKKYPDHPLADFARLSSYRVPFFSAVGRPANDEIWTTLFDVAKRHPGRAVWEMRYMVRHARYPSAALLASQDPMLAAAVLRSSALDSGMLDEAEWERFWKRAMTVKDERVATLLQESLLHLAYQSFKKAPPGYPKDPTRPSALWAKWRLAGLLKFGEDNAALAQALTTPPDADRYEAQLAARAFVLSGRPALALKLANLSRDQATYLIQVGLNEDQLAAIVKDKGPFASAAALMMAIRTSREAGWAAGAKHLAAFDADKAKAFESLAILAADKSKDGRLRYATAVAKLEFFPRSGEHWRAFKTRYEHLLKPEERKDHVVLPDERRRLEWVLTEGDPQYRTLEAYVAYLQVATPGSKDAKDQLRAADGVFNYLYNAGNWDNPEYRALLDGSQVAKDLRAAGRRINRG